MYPDHSSSIRHTSASTSPPHIHHFVRHSSYSSGVSSHVRSFTSGKTLRIPLNTLQIGLARHSFPRFHRAHPSLPLDLILDPQFPRQPPACLPFFRPLLSLSRPSVLAVLEQTEYREGLNPTRVCPCKLLSDLKCPPIDPVCRVCNRSPLHPTPPPLALLPSTSSHCGRCLVQTSFAHIYYKPLGLEHRLYFHWRCARG